MSGEWLRLGDAWTLFADDLFATRLDRLAPAPTGIAGRENGSRVSATVALPGQQRAGPRLNRDGRT